MVDIEPGMYAASQRVTFMNGLVEYYEISREEFKYFTCRKTTHKEFLSACWKYSGPSEVCKW
jgi:hypothetical protein